MKSMNDLAQLQSCMVEVAGISQTCSACYAQEFHCTIEECDEPCTADATGSACLACSNKYCTADFERCSGVEAPVSGFGPTDSDGKCLNPDDSTICHDSERMIGITTDCGKKCRGDRACTTECVEKAADISDTCADCYGQDAACVRQN